MNRIFENLPLVITLFSALAGAAGFFAARVRHNYGLERDIGHLKRDYQSLSMNLESELQDMERRIDKAEREIAVVSNINKLLLAQLQGRSIGYGEELN